MIYHWVVVVLILTLMLVFLPIKFGINLKRADNELFGEVILVLWVIPIHIRINNIITSFFFKLSKDRFWEKKTPDDISMQDVSWQRMGYRLKMIRIIGGNIYKNANSVFYKWSQPIKINRLNIHIELGLNDAFQTAIAVGTGWAILGIVYSVLSHSLDLKNAETQFMLNPNFNMRNNLHIDFSCIFEFRLGHIIIIIYQVMRSAKDIWKLVRRVNL